LNAARVVIIEKSFQAFVAKALYRHEKCVKRQLTDVKARVV
jgi:hypothetical protein